MSLHRRRFLEISSCLGAAGLLLPGWTLTAFAQEQAQQDAWLLGSGIRDGNAFVLFSNLTSNRFGRIPIPTLGHSILRHPAKAYTALSIPKKMSVMSEVDLKSKKLIQSIDAGPGMSFYGHGAFNKDGSKFFTSEIEFETQKGVVKIRDGKTYREIGRVDSHGLRPHDIMLIENDTIAILTHGGLDRNQKDTAIDLRTNVTFVELATGKLLKRLVPDRSGFEIGHVALSKDGYLLGGSFPQSGETYGDTFVAKPNGKFTQLEVPPAPIAKKLKDQILSLALDSERALVAATSPKSGLVLFWNYKKNKFLKALEMKDPHGVVLTEDGKHFVITARNPKISWIKTADLTLEAGHPAGNPITMISHSTLYKG